MASEYTSPSQKTIDFLYKGVIAFYPDVARTAFLLGKAPLPYLSKWGGFERLDFLDLVLNTTQSDSIEAAASVIKNWHDGRALDKTIPANLNELVEDLDNANKSKNEYNKQVLAKKTLFESEKIKTEPKGEKPIEIPQPSQQVEVKSQEIPSGRTVVSTPATPIEVSPSKVEHEKVKELKSDPIEEINKADAVTLGINITETGEADPVAVQSFAPLRSNIFYATKKITKEEGGTVAAGLNLWAHGITATQLTTKIQSKFPELEPKHAKKIEDVIKVIHGLETDPIKTNLARAAFPTKDIDILLSSRSGVTQTEVAIFFNPVVPGVEGDGVIYHESESFFKNIVSSAGQQLFGTIAKKGAEKAIGTTFKALATKVAIKAGTKVVGQAAATAVAPGVANAILFVATEILEKFLSRFKDLVSKIKEFSKEMVVAGLAFIAGGAFSGSMVILGVGVGIGGIGVLNGGLSGFGKTLGNIGSASLAGLTTLVLPAVGLPLITGIIFIPILIALILFIINSGAYLVPPSPGSSGVSTNPYISVIKTANPQGPFQNSSLPLEVTYTVVVSAKKGALTNIKIKDECTVSRKGTSPKCPSPNPAISSISIPETIQPGSPFTFSYSMIFSNQTYSDSLVMNSITVTADSPESPANTEVGSESIIIGTPPTGCFNIAGNWPSSEKSMITSAVTSLVQKAPSFLAKLCAAYPQVNVYYDPPNVCGPWGCAPGGNVIYLNSGGLKNIYNATYILAHEASHVLSYGNGKLYQSYLSYPGTLSELPVCGYGGKSDGEGFAQAISETIMGAACVNNSPNNKKFAQEKILR